MAAGTATIRCTADGFQSSYPKVHVSYQTGADAGIPGLFWFGLLSPDDKLGAVLTPNGWTTYEGGLYPFHSRYDGGLPATIQFVVPFPDRMQSTGPYVGYRIYAGHGVYTPEMRDLVVTRRQSLNAVKPDMQAQGRWRVEFDTDDNFIWSLIQRDMVDKRKYGTLLTIPAIDCYGSGGMGGGL
jgi:hypothetical protein